VYIQSNTVTKDYKLKISLLMAFKGKHVGAGGGGGGGENV
jgi:hypothetical protein